MTVKRSPDNIVMKLLQSVYRLMPIPAGTDNDEHPRS